MASEKGTEKVEIAKRENVTADAARLREQIRARIVLVPQGYSQLEALHAQREQLRRILVPLKAWFDQVAQGYRDHRDGFFLLNRRALYGDDYWPVPGFREHAEQLTWHVEKAEEYLMQALSMLGEHEHDHPLIAQVFQDLERLEILYGQLFLYRWMPVSAWIGDLQITWWDGPAVADLRGHVRAMQARAFALDRRFTVQGLEALREQWCTLRKKNPADLAIVEQPDGRSALLVGYAERTGPDYRLRTIQNEFMDWAFAQRLPSLSYDRLFSIPAPAIHR